MSHAVVIDGLPLSYGHEEVKRLCEPFGQVVRVELKTMPDATSLGYAHVVMGSGGAADAVRSSLDGRRVSNHALSVYRVSEETGR